MRTTDLKMSLAERKELLAGSKTFQPFDIAQSVSQVKRQNSFNLSIRKYTAVDGNESKDMAEAGRTTSGVNRPDHIKRFGADDW